MVLLPIRCPIWKRSSNYEQQTQVKADSYGDRGRQIPRRVVAYPAKFPEEAAGAVQRHAMPNIAGIHSNNQQRSQSKPQSLGVQVYRGDVPF
jgi:hypothetical protein